VHVDVIDGQGVYQNPLRFLPPLTDNEPPRILGFYTSIPQVGEKWLAVVAASDSRRGHDSRWLS
jgi:hypothetical protein